MQTIMYRRAYTAETRHRFERNISASLTSIANNADGWRREEENPFSQQHQFPQDEYGSAEEVDELREAAGRVRDLHRMVY